MIVYGDGCMVGTIGGSAVEKLVSRDAQEAIKTSKPRRVEYNLDDVEKSSTGMICGGVMEFFIEPLKQFPRLYIFGGGHVGLAIARLAAESGYPHIVFDEREEFVSKERFPQASELHSGDYEVSIEKVKFIQPAYLLIITHTHEADYRVLKQVLRREYKYLGMICSRRKKAQMWEKLQDEGFSEEALNRVHAPIGLDIGAKTPAELAISILAEVILEFHGPKHK